jgi:membrane-associated phospholipid phosphatase
MEAILQWGLNLIRAIQTVASPPLTGIMTGITWLGSTAAYLAIIPFIYWCIDEKKGFRLTLALLVSAWINITVKFLLDQPRPFFPGYDPTVGLIHETMGGFPSGHAQNALVIWVIAASWIKNKWAYISAYLLCFLISFSRVYLGVHFPSDILGGWLLGGLVLCGYFFLGGRIERSLDKGGPRAKMIVIALCAFLMILYRPHDGMLMNGGLLLGVGAGNFLDRKYIGFAAALPDKNAGQKALLWLARFAIGIAVTAALYLGLKKAFQFVQDSNFESLLYFTRYCLVGLWVSAGAPALFSVTRLAAKGLGIIK